MKMGTRIFIVITFILSLVYAISITKNELWLSVWFLLLIFVGVPIILLTIRDLVVNFKPKWMGASQLLLHICALFSAILGFGLGYAAVQTGHEKAHIHQLLVIILPLMVYATPLLMLFHGMPFSEIKNFYYKPNKSGK